jgi:bifunctional ADP-heptose synthase (sugar kinase/adenylyltransferase)
MLEAIQYIDFIYIYDDETPIIPLKELLPDFLVK